MIHINNLDKARDLAVKRDRALNAIKLATDECVVVHVGYGSAVECRFVGERDLCAAILPVLRAHLAEIEGKLIALGVDPLPAVAS